LISLPYLQLQFIPSVMFLTWFWFAAVSEPILENFGLLFIPFSLWIYPLYDQEWQLWDVCVLFYYLVQVLPNKSYTCNSLNRWSYSTKVWLSLYELFSRISVIVMIFVVCYMYLKFFKFCLFLGLGRNESELKDEQRKEKLK